MPTQKLVWECSRQQELMRAKKEQRSMAVSSRVGQDNVAPSRKGTEFSPTKESAWRARSQGHGAWKHYVKCKSQTRESTYCPILSTWHVKNSQIYGQRKQTSGYQELGVRGWGRWEVTANAQGVLWRVMTDAQLCEESNNERLYV